MRHKLILFNLLLIVVFILSFAGCKNNDSRINELENKVTELQKQLSEKENTITSIQNTTETTAIEKETSEALTQKTDEDLIKEVIEKYINAIEKQDFAEQKNYVINYAMDLVNMKEQELYETKSQTSKYTIIKNPINNIVVNGNNAEAFISFTEHGENYDGSKFDIVTEGKAYLKKIDDAWKISDYTRKNHLISEALFVFEDLSNSSNNVKIKINYVLFSLTDKYAVLGIDIVNDSKERLMYFLSAKIIGPDKRQTEAGDSSGNLRDIMPDSIATGTIEFSWNYDSTNNLTFYSGSIDKTDDGSSGYNFIGNIKIDVDLSKAKKY
jgi:predicted DNA-binding protein